MGEVVELNTRIPEGLSEDDSPEFEAFLVAEGLELLAEFRSIEDPTVRQSILLMVTKLAAALRSR